MMCGVMASCGVGSSKASSLPSGVGTVYMAFGVLGFMLHHLVANGEFSSVLTLSVVFQCLAFSLLFMQAITTGSVGGISAKSLGLDAFAITCRLSSTTWLQGYLPWDETGDHLYQALDIVSLIMVLCLLHRLLVVQRNTYDVNDDGLSPYPFACGCLVLAAILHGNLDERPIFDTLWMCGLFTSAVSVLPQLWMMTQSGKKVPALTAHFVAMMAVGRIVSGVYMWYAYEEIECYPWVGDFNHAGFSVLAAHVVHLVLLGDFGYYYFKHMAQKGMGAALEFPVTSWEV
jgi:hypothetical protein